MIRVLLCEDHELVRMGLSIMIDKSEDITLIGEAENGLLGVELAKQLSPDIVLMDIGLPNIDGIEATKRIKDFNPQIKVLIFTSRDDSDDIFAAFKSGADGYILKEMDNTKIIQSVKAVSNGISVLGANVYSGIQKRIASTNRRSEPANSAALELSEREREIIILITEGYDNKNIAQKLFLAEGTVRNIISRMLDKLGLKDRTQLAVFAVKNNII